MSVILFLSSNKIPAFVSSYYSLSVLPLPLILTPSQLTPVLDLSPYCDRLRPRGKERKNAMGKGSGKVSSLKK